MAALDLIACGSAALSDDHAKETPVDSAVLIAHLLSMIDRSRHIAMMACLSLAVIANATRADETLSLKAAESQAPVINNGLTVRSDLASGQSLDLTGARAVLALAETPKPPVRLALCGVEADAGNSSLDAGLIDLNIPESARINDRPDTGNAARDYHAAVFVGVTLGYHF